MADEDGKAKFYGAMSRGWRGTLYDANRKKVWRCSHNHPTDAKARACARDELNKRNYQAEQDRNKARTETGDGNG